MKKVAGLLILSILSINFINAQEKFSISEKEIEIAVDDITLSGTLLLPETEKKVPLVILVSGGFPDNRDAEAYGFKPFQILANHLASKGVASYRYDDRGVGKSTGRLTYNYTINELTNDVHAAIKSLKRLEYIDTMQIGIVGHSLGGIMAPQIANNNKDVSFIVALGASYTDPLKMNLRVIKESYVKSGWQKKYIDKALELHTKIKEVAVTGKGYDDLVNEMKKASKEEFESLPENKKKRYKNPDNYYKSSWYGMYEPLINTPFMKSWFESIPSGPLETLKCPTLFLMGEFDPRADINHQGPVIIKSLDKAGNNNYAIRQVPGSNHYFRNRRNTKEKGFAPGFLEIVSNWIKEQSKMNGLQ